MTHYFITGTGTEVGKTVIASALSYGFSKEGSPIAYWKAIQCGPEEDRETLRGGTPQCEILDNGFTYALPASPDQAALAENKEQASVQKLLGKVAAFHDKTLLIEGAGGLLVPLNTRGETWLDFVTRSLEFTPQIILVAQSGLGTLNHTALSINSLLSRGVQPACIILCGKEHSANRDSLKRMFPEFAQNLYSFPFLAETYGHPDWNAACTHLWQFLHKQSVSPKSPAKEDQKFVWHPFTQHGLKGEPVPIIKARGSWLLDIKGNRLFDTTSSWWVNTVGHGRLEIATAIARQQQIIDHVVFAGATHNPGANLSQKIIEKTGGKLQKVFFTDNGSCAVEVAMKMAIQLADNQGLKKSKFVALKGGYHGDTFGAMSVGQTTGFYEPFKHFLAEHIWLSPVTDHPSSLCPLGKLAYQENLRHMEEVFARNHLDMIGVIIEPLIQGATGMVVHYMPWLKKLGELANFYKIPLILDEVFTGMGRSGSFFAFQRAELNPDIVCLSKGLTGGNLPLALTLTTKEIFDHFLSTDIKKAFLHGHSFTANPIACAAALATLQIYEKDNLLVKSREMEDLFLTWIKGPGHDLGVHNPRAIGGMLAFEAPGSKAEDYFAHKGRDFARKAMEKGLFMRPLGNTLYVVPPLSTETSDLNFVLDRLNEVLAH